MSLFADAVESKDHLIEVWTALVLDRGGQVDTDDGVVRMWADSPFGFWNTVALDGVEIPVDALSDQLGRAAAFMRSRAQAGYVWIFEDLLSPPAKAELFDRAAEAGLELGFTGYGMTGDLSIPEPVHPELEFRRVRTADELMSYGQINASAYAMSAEAGPAALAGSEYWLRNTYAYIAYRDGLPVACAATIGGANSVFRALVATVPGPGQRGYGEVVTRKTIYEGIKATGHRHLVLHATPAGRPVYERIGCTINTPVHFLQLAGADSSAES